MNRNAASTERLTKAHFRLKVFTFMRERQEDGTEKLKKVNTEIDNMRGSDFQKSLQQIQAKGEKVKIEYCKQEPTEFQLGVFYVRIDGEEVYVFTEQANPEEVDIIEPV